MLLPLPRCSAWAYSSLISPRHISLPRKGRRVGLHIVLFEACSAFTRVAACTLALSPIRDTLSEGFSHFVTSMTAPVASGWSGRRVGLAPTGKAPPYHGAHPIPDNPTVPARDVQRSGNPDTEDPFAVELDRYGDAFQHRRRRDRLVRRNLEEIGLPPTKRIVCCFRSLTQSIARLVARY
jgi:hypothetical protein